MNNKKQFKDYKNSKVFCAAPFLHMYIHTNEPPKVCCVAVPDFNKQLSDSQRNLSADWKSEIYSSIRDMMLNEQAPDVCIKCYTNEQYGKYSDRQMYNERFIERHGDIHLDAHTGTVEFESPIDLDLRPSNLCNLACRMCSPDSSSQIVKEHANNQELIGEYYYTVNNSPSWNTQENLMFLLKNINSDTNGTIKFLGGEPTIMPEVESILDYLVANGITDNALKFTTNLTNLNKRFLSNIEKFKNVKISVSMDGIGSVVEYIRHPVNWDILENNIKLVAGITSSRIGCQQAIQAYNIFNLKEIFAWLYNIRQETGRHDIYFDSHVLDWPVDLSYKAIPKVLRDNAILDFLQSTEFQQFSVYNDLENNEMIADVSGAMKKILNDSSDESSTLLPLLGKRTARFDKVKKQHIKDHIPAVWDIIEPYYKI